MYQNYLAVEPAHAPGAFYTPHAGLGVVTSIGPLGADELLHDMVYPDYNGDFVGPPAPVDKPSDVNPYIIKTPTVWAEAPSIPWWVWAALGIVAYKALSK